jgi:hypothetical protein
LNQVYLFTPFMPSLQPGPSFTLFIRPFQQGFLYLHHLSIQPFQPCFLPPGFLRHTNHPTHSFKFFHAHYSSNPFIPVLFTHTIHPTLLT